MLLDAGSDLLHTLVVGPLAYVAIVLFLRISGKRTLAKMNAFDLVVTVALGSTVATIFLSKDVALAQGLLAIVLLVALQFLVATAASRSDAFQTVVKAVPRLLLVDGRMDERALRQERVAREEVLAAVRADGYARLQDVGFVVLETDGTFSVIGRTDGAPATALANVRGIDPPPGERGSG